MVLLLAAATGCYWLLLAAAAAAAAGTLPTEQGTHIKLDLHTYIHDLLAYLGRDVSGVVDVEPECCIYESRKHGLKRPNQITGGACPLKLQGWSETRDLASTRKTKDGFA